MGFAGFICSFHLALCSAIFCVAQAADKATASVTLAVPATKSIDLHLCSQHYSKPLDTVDLQCQARHKRLDVPGEGDPWQQSLELLHRG